METRGEGVYGPDLGGCRELTSNANTIFGFYYNVDIDTAYEANSSATACIRSLRPDLVEGFAHVTVSDEEYIPFEYHIEGYDTLELIFPFRVLYSDHAGIDDTLPWDYLTIPDEIGTVFHIYFDISYDEAWPWDDITDPDVREQVYERYIPYNAL
jgi:hypothetical protein